MSTPLWLQNRIPKQVYFHFRKLPKLIWVLLISLKGNHIYYLQRGCNYCSNQAAAWKQLGQHKHKALKLGLEAFSLSTTEATRQFDPMHMVIVQQLVKEITGPDRTEQRRTMFTALLFVWGNPCSRPYISKTPTVTFAFHLAALMQKCNIKSLGHTKGILRRESSADCCCRTLTRITTKCNSFSSWKGLERLVF